MRLLKRLTKEIKYNPTEAFLFITLVLTLLICIALEVSLIIKSH